MESVELGRYENPLSNPSIDTRDAALNQNAAGYASAIPVENTSVP
jgi:hypothetical protein